MEAMSESGGEELLPDSSNPGIPIKGSPGSSNDSNTASPADPAQYPVLPSDPLKEDGESSMKSLDTVEAPLGISPKLPGTLGVKGQVESSVKEFLYGENTPTRFVPTHPSPM